MEFQIAGQRQDRGKKKTKTHKKTVERPLWCEGPKRDTSNLRFQIREGRDSLHDLREGIAHYLGGL